MKFINKFDHYISAIFIIAIVVIIATSYFTFKEFFNSNNQRQQEAVMPLLTLITKELITPLTVSKYMASDPFLINYIQQEQLDHDVIFRYLDNVSDRFDTLSFIAIEQHQVMLNSTHESANLSVPDAHWYHRLKNIDKEHFIDIGNADNPHLFFDVRITHQQQFLGFVGLGIDLDYFAKEFSNFYQRFGYEVYFANAQDRITLSSQQLLGNSQTTSPYKPMLLSDISWYPAFLESQQDDSKGVTSQHIIDSDAGELIIAKMPLKELGWRVFIVTPPENQKAEYWLLFIPRLAVFLLISLILYAVFTLCIINFKSRLVKDSETDFLTQLPNRSYIHWKYDQLIHRHDHVSVVIADIDNFKVINDTYGHLFGDDVLKIIAQQLSENLRGIDLTGRWGGEEFILILPDTTASQAQEIIDRIRQNIENIPFSSASTSKPFNVTVSFGIRESTLADVSLHDILAKADQALYQAKSSGRNQVVIHME